MTTVTPESLRPIVTRSERGWPGHYICADQCKFRRNTLLECGDIRIVVSTVGNQKKPGSRMTADKIGYDRYYETMAFHAKHWGKYLDADVCRQVELVGRWTVSEMTTHADADANEMHEAAVREVSTRLAQGETYQCDDAE